MKAILIVLSGWMLLACSSSKAIVEEQPGEPTYPFTISVQIKGAHCGGAAPDMAMMEEIQRAKPYANAKVFLRSGTLNEWERPADLELVSNEKGVISARLPVGEYAVVFEDKANKVIFDQLMERYGTETQSYRAIDEECLRIHFNRPEAVLRVTADGSNELTIIYQEKCSWQKVPCAAFKGNLPP